MEAKDNDNVTTPAPGHLTTTLPGSAATTTTPTTAPPTTTPTTTTAQTTAAPTVGATGTTTPGVTTPTTPFDNSNSTVYQQWLTMKDKIKSDYKDTSMNVWYAAAAHGVTFVLAFGRFMMVKNRL